MGCRCSEIAICQRDLSILSGGVSSGLNSASNFNNPISPALGAGASALGEAIYIDNLGDLQQQLSKANMNQDRSIPQLFSRLASETSKVSGMLSSFTAEDTAYHAEENKH